ncbi:hypothetical protein Ga0080574_TMP5145 (plasmid) [Salipiger abyssi]|uniref:Uncharacterized protein n=1 Tax=Salipiger abyssi TaxID=1250539 RepID=A0A1P8V1C5_9RHOB|nr:hypothetical protein Ga0080574_TMP5145 [Salipiger abyssi]
MIAHDPARVFCYSPFNNANSGKHKTRKAEFAGFSEVEGEKRDYPQTDTRFLGTHPCVKLHLG